MSRYRVVHYINQFYAGIGGEEKADHRPEMREGPVGPGTALASLFGDKAEVVNTIICGDSYFNENPEEAAKTLLGMMRIAKPDVFIAGPAFNAGRYGFACGAICEAVQQELGIPVLTGMYEENPGADMFREKLYIIATSNNAAGMRKVIPKMVSLALKLADGESIGASIEEGYLPGRARVNFFEKKRGSKRAVEMLLKKMAGQPFTTEYPMPDFDRVNPNHAVKDINNATVALVTSGGIVPKGNPDHIESSSASKFGEYDITGVNDLTPDFYETAHGGYDPVYANQDADRVLPVDVLREFEREGRIGKLHSIFYATVGNGTSTNKSKQFAQEFAQSLRDDNVQAVILTST